MGWIKRPPVPDMRTVKKSQGAGFSEESFPVEFVQNFLFYFTRGRHVSPRFFLTLAGKEFQVMQNFAQHWFGLVLDFFKEYFLRAHDKNIAGLNTSCNSGTAKALTLIA